MKTFLSFIETDFTFNSTTAAPESGVLPRLKSRKTKIWSVQNDEGEELGEILWYNSWRQYCYFQKPEIVMSIGCLLEITNFIKQQMDARKVSA